MDDLIKITIDNEEIISAYGGENKNHYLSGWLIPYNQVKRMKRLNHLKQNEDR